MERHPAVRAMAIADRKAPHAIGVLRADRA